MIILNPNAWIEQCECSPERAELPDFNEQRPDVAAAELERAHHTERADLLLQIGAQQLHVERHAEHELERRHSERDRPRVLHTLHNRRERHYRLRRRVLRPILEHSQREHSYKQYAFFVV